MRAGWPLILAFLCLPAVGADRELSDFDEFRSYPFMERAYRAADAGDWRQTEELTRFLLTKVPDHRQARQLLVQALAGQGEFAEALEILRGDDEQTREQRFNLRRAWLARGNPSAERVEGWLEETAAPRYTRLWQAYALKMDNEQGPAAVLGWLQRIRPRNDGDQLAVWRARYAERAGEPETVVDVLEPLLAEGTLPEAEKGRLAQAYLLVKDYQALERVLATLDNPRQVRQWRIKASRRAIGSGQPEWAMRWLDGIDPAALTPQLRQSLWQLVVESKDAERILEVGDRLGRPCLSIVAALAPVDTERARGRLDRCEPGEDPRRWLVLARETGAVEALADRAFPDAWREQQQEQLVAMWRERDDVQAALDWLERQPRSAGTLRREAELAQSRGLYGRAIPLWLALYQRSADLRALDQATFLLASMGRHRRALRELEAAWENRDLNRTLYERMAGLYARQDTEVDPERAEALLEVLDREARGALLTRLANADLCELVETAVPPPPRSAAEWRVLGECAMPARPGAAAVFYRRALEKEPAASTRKALAYALADGDDPAGAAELFLQFPPAELDDRGRLAAARELRLAGNIGAAERYWQQVEERDSTVWHAGALIALEAGEQELALERERRALSGSADPALYYAASGVALKADDREQSLQWLARAVALAPDNPRYRADYGLRLADQPDSASRLAAIPYLEAAVEAMPEDFRLHHALGLRYAERGDGRRAREQLRAAVDNLEPRLQVAGYSRGQLAQLQYDQRRSHEALARRNSVSLASTWHPDGITTTPGRQLDGENTQILLWDHRLTDEPLRRGGQLAVYGRLLASGDGRGQYGEGAGVGLGLRYKPLADHNVNLYAELYGDRPTSSESLDTDLMLRATASFLDGGRYRNDWRAAADNWPRRSLYLDAAWFTGDDERQLLARFERGHAWKLPLSGAQTLEPYGVLQAVEQNGGEDWRVGLGVRWQLWFDADKYNAFRKRVSLRAEYQKDLAGGLYEDASGWLFGLEVHL